MISALAYAMQHYSQQPGYENNLSFCQQIGKEECGANTVEYYSATKKKKKEILTFVIWMGLEGIMLREINPTEKDKYCLISFKCVI